MYVDTDITAVVGMVGQVRGNIAYSMAEDTAKKIVSAMMMGMPVEELDEMGRSALGEFSTWSQEMPRPSIQLRGAG